jgi:tRNA A-37 threonylcarbamoyl transferase component Bud32
VITTPRTVASASGETPVGPPERYELIDRIAVGGMAEVYRAVAYGSHGFEKNLAIKRILPELARDPEFEDRFIAEAKLAVRLSHANVVQVLDFGRLAGTLFIAMELVDGLDLAELLRRSLERGDRIPIPAAFHMAIEIARGLDFAHQHGVVHRDVSPSNILLSRAGEVKIADFGIALAAGDRRAAAADRRRIMGKWRYMSPEQARGEPLGTGSDIFSAAAVWFELFTGDKLFPGGEAEAIIGNITEMAIPPASERRPGLPSGVDDLLVRALERDPARRPAAADLLRGLIELSYGSTIVASALDVKAAVNQALDTGPAPIVPRPGGRAIDDFIREQLLAGEDGATDPEPARRTAVADAAPPSDSDAAGPDPQADAAPAPEPTGLSIVRRGVDPDGVTCWEMDEEAVAGDHPTAVGGALESDRSAASSDAELAPRPKPARRGRSSALVALALAGGGAVAWQVFGASGDRPVEPDSRAAHAVAVGEDASPPVRGATLVLDSRPRGARVFVDGRPLAAPTFTTADVEAERPCRIRLELDGYRVHEEEITPGVGERVRITPRLEPRRASLRVTTRPAGAEVWLDGERVGLTPLERDDLRPGKGRALILRKPEYREMALSIDLTEAIPVDIERRLDSAIIYGRVNLHIRDSWADVTLAGKPVGRAPGTIRLPVGQHHLRLYNRFSKKEKTVTVEVLADKVKTYQFEL